MAPKNGLNGLQTLVTNHLLIGMGPPSNVPSPHKKRPYWGLICHQFPLIRPKIQPLFLRGGRWTSHNIKFTKYLLYVAKIESSKPQGRYASRWFLAKTHCPICRCKMVTRKTTVSILSFQKKKGSQVFDVSVRVPVLKPCVFFCWLDVLGCSLSVGSIRQKSKW